VASDEAVASSAPDGENATARTVRSPDPVAIIVPEGA
jgi:hypothetical protein